MSDQVGNPEDRFSHNEAHMSRVMRKPVSGVSDQVRHKPGCTATETRSRLEILDLGRRRIVLSMKRKTGVDQLCGHRAAQ